MREELGKIGKVSGQTFIATFERFGKKRAFKRPDLIMLLFRDMMYQT